MDIWGCKWINRLLHAWFYAATFGGQTWPGSRLLWPWNKQTGVGTRYWGGWLSSGGEINCISRSRQLATQPRVWRRFQRCRAGDHGVYGMMKWPKELILTRLTTRCRRWRCRSPRVWRFQNRSFMFMCLRWWTRQPWTGVFIPVRIHGETIMHFREGKGKITNFFRLFKSRVMVRKVTLPWNVL